MIILDEYFPESQRQLLLSRRINIRQIGIEVGRKGLQDDEIILLLLKYIIVLHFSGQYRNMVSM